MISVPLLIVIGVGALAFAWGMWLSSAAPKTKKGAPVFAAPLIIIGGFASGTALLIQIIRLI